MIIHNPSGATSEELRKWEQHNTIYAMTPDGDFKPGNPYVFRPYPKMLFMAKTNPKTGKMSVGEVQPAPWLYTNMQDLERDTNFVEGFNRQCQKIVQNEDEDLKAQGQGWCEKQDEALRRAEKHYEDMAEEAARVHYQVARMGEKARAEFKEADASTSQHILDVKPKRKRGRPAKGVKPVEISAE
jgi:uncharacterized protein (DUF4415 family)